MGGRYMSSAPGRRGDGPAAGSGQEYPSDPQYTSQGSQHNARDQQYQQAGGQPPGAYQQSGQGRAGTATYQDQPAGYYQRGYGPSDEERHATAAKVGARLAGVLMVLSGIFGFIVGLAALARGAFYTVSGNYYYAWNHRGWGLTELILGCVLVAAGVCLILGMLWARIVGIFVAALNAIAAFMFLPRSPISSIVLIALNLFIIWAIVHYHHRSLTST
jgi:hypothetical protein